MTTTEKAADVKYPTSHVLRLRPAQVAQHPDNIRDATRDLDALASSIKEVGVLVPLIVVPVASIEGDWPAEVTHIAVDGNRRQAAAAQVDAELPCIVDSGTTSGTRTQTMVVTNLARDGLTAREQAGAIQSMLDLGISQAAIARATGLKSKTVRSAKAAASLPESTAAAAEQQGMTLDQLAILADWQEKPDDVQSLIRAAHSGYFDHQLQQLKNDKKAEKALAAAIAKLEAAGIVVVLERRAPATRLVELAPLPGVEGYSLSEDSHMSCPGRAVWVADSWDGVQNIELCLDPAKYGHERLYGSHSSGGSGAGGVSPEEATEQRRELIRRNKEMVAAQDLRFDFITRVWQAKEHAKAVAAWALGRVVAGDGTFVRWAGDYRGMTGLDRILGTADPKAMPASKHPALLWAMVTAAYESEFPKDAWRHPDRARARYLEHLVSLGYGPCESELLLINGAPAAGDDFDEELDDDGAPAAPEIVDLPDIAEWDGE